MAQLRGLNKLNWQFWRKDKKDLLEQALQQLDEVKQGLESLAEQASGNSEQMLEIVSTINKLARVQYKTGQDVQGRLGELSSAAEGIRQWQAAHEVDVAKLNLLGRRIDYLAEVIISWLDDIDLILDRLEAQDTWRPLLDQWAAQLREALSKTGIYELQLLGCSFEPQLAEAIGTVSPSQSGLPRAGDTSAGPNVPYEIVKIVKRGFVAGDGRLIRKAQVITVKEEELN